ncbi:MAG: hypothetical protein QOG91_111 [Candidatus Parcubacteria bacterium]|nr:hypothetical protein [Candidatus Parcubacteria bacterium]
MPTRVEILEAIFCLITCCERQPRPEIEMHPTGASMSIKAPTPTVKPIVVPAGSHGLFAEFQYGVSFEAISAAVLLVFRPPADDLGSNGFSKRRHEYVKYSASDSERKPKIGISMPYADPLINDIEEPWYVVSQEIGNLILHMLAEEEFVTRAFEHAPAATATLYVPYAYRLEPALS